MSSATIDRTVESSTQKVSVAGGHLYVEQAGSGPPILLLHGWTLDRRMWRPQMAGLSDRLHLIAPDRRGYGRSTAPPGLAQEVEDIATLLDHVGLTRVTLVGQSQGGRVAVAFATSHPERVAALVLIAAPHDAVVPDPVREPPIPIERMTALVRAGELGAARAIWRAHPMLHSADPDAVALRNRMLDTYAGRDLLAPASPNLPVNDARLASIPCPTLVLVGDQDAPSRVAAAERLATTLPQARLHRISGGGHLCNISHADACNRLIADAAIGSVH